jgi:hypothetical protein
VLAGKFEMASNLRSPCRDKITSLADPFDLPTCSQYRLSQRSPVKPTRFSPFRRKICSLQKVYAKPDPDRWNAESLGLNAIWVEYNEKVAAEQTLWDNLIGELDMLKGADHPQGVCGSQDPRRLQVVLQTVAALDKVREEEWESWWSKPEVCTKLPASVTPLSKQKAHEIVTRLPKA